MKRSHFAKILLLLMMAVSGHKAVAQSGIIQGKVIDPVNQPIDDVRISVAETGFETRSAEDGSFRITLEPGKVYHINFNHVAHQSATLEIRIEPGRIYDRSIKLLQLESAAVDIIGEKDPTSIDDRETMLVNPISLEQSMEIPIPTASVEQLAKLQPGVASTSEFSSQYQVRGGNFDENLVYVNGIEIYRPFLARSGQQEGLGFSNASMAQGLKFSTGGFGAQYGDKMSSVLDITYRQPREFKATAELGILTTNLHIEGISRNKSDPEEPGKFTYLMGARRFSMAYLLNSLDTRGEYSPLFMDYQGMFTYTPKTRKQQSVRYREKANGKVDTIYSVNTPLKITAFVTTSRNRYLFEPVTKQTTFGTLQQAFRLLVAFEGRELSAYTTSLGAVLIEQQPSSRLKLDYIFTAFNTQEEERFDVEGGYLLGQVNTNFGSDEFNEAEFDLGIGSEFRHARNFLTSNVLSAQMKGLWLSDNQARHRLQFGAKVQYQTIQDDLKEYSVLDSAGYLVDSLGKFGREEYIRGQITLESFQYSAFFQHEWKLNSALALHTGLRGMYYDLIDSWMFSPRVQLLWKAAEKDGETTLRFRLASGLYYQPPFYREFRRFDGTVNLDVKPQRSLHFIGGMDYRFFGWGRPFRLFTEAYYKGLNNLIPYEVQNVRVRYYPDEVAKGYAYGVDARLNGEFIKGIDSWVSVGFLKTMEDIEGDEQGYVPRPSDQRFTFSMFFQDELPINPTYKVQMTYVYGSGMRYGPPQSFDLRTNFGFPPYHRLDIGFSKLITILPDPYKKIGIESIWGTLEIFNLLQRENTVSYVWVKDLQNNSFAVPNYLSARLLNLRIIVKFR
ncbi:MAG: TonB-dependent receptor [Bacteroidia bacterium]|nr:TonB-dependent receptor [Bacteroidia bacterium]